MLETLVSILLVRLTLFDFSIYCEPTTELLSQSHSWLLPYVGRKGRLMRCC